METCFELSKAADGQFRFALKGDHAQTLLASELYRTKDSAQGGIAAVQKNCGSDAHYEKKVATNGKFFFNLKAANNQVIGTSPMYASEQDRDAGLAATKASGATAPVRDSV
jgi:uncharacterized protein YegP (UPF0339 family)